MDIPHFADLLAGRVGTITIEPDGAQQIDGPPAGAILSGAFNPLHAGHMGMAAAAAALCNTPVAFDLAVRNADKGALTAAEAARRAAQFAGKAPLVLSAAPLFAQKATLYPGRIFVIGYDTAVRLLDPRYYGGEPALRAALDHLRVANCRFLVAGRLTCGRFQTLADLTIPVGYTDIADPIPEGLFRADISSTELRRGA
ncbi:MAG: hypothetical protein WCF99_13125 [Chloroflexales bacterium]